MPGVGGRQPTVPTEGAGHRTTAGPVADSDRDLHARLLAHDPTAASDLAVSFLEPEAQARLLALAAQRAAARRALLASALLAYAESEGLDETGLAARLGCRPDRLPVLKLCLRPRKGLAFRTDVERIAARFELDPAPLADVIRLADGVEALRQATNATGSGLMVAARDREAEPSEDQV